MILSKPKIVVKMAGGLGNQMFQYAMGRSLASKKEVPLILDISQFKYDDFYKRTFLLDELNVNYDYSFEITGVLSGFIHRNINRFKRLLGYRKVVIEPVFYNNQAEYRVMLSKGIPNSKYEEDIQELKIDRRVEFFGYWQSYKYFENFREVLLKEFIPKNIKQILCNNKELLRSMEGTDSVCVGVRRYNESVMAEKHYKVPISYYEKSIEEIVSKVKNPHFFVFTLDQKWAKKNIKIRYPHTFIKADTAKQGVINDLYLMSKCKHFIIPNSTYHWWGAWLSNTINKIVIAPKLGWGNSNAIPDSWLKI